MYSFIIGFFLLPSVKQVNPLSQNIHKYIQHGETMTLPSVSHSLLYDMIRVNTQLMIKHYIIVSSKSSLNLNIKKTPESCSPSLIGQSNMTSILIGQSV